MIGTVERSAPSIRQHAPINIRDTFDASQGHRHIEFLGDELSALATPASPPAPSP